MKVPASSASPHVTRLADRPLRAVSEDSAGHGKGEDQGHDQRDHGPSPPPRRPSGGALVNGCTTTLPQRLRCPKG